MQESDNRKMKFHMMRSRRHTQFSSGGLYPLVDDNLFHVDSGFCKLGMYFCQVNHRYPLVRCDPQFPVLCNRHIGKARAAFSELITSARPKSA